MVKLLALRYFILVGIILSISTHSTQAQIGKKFKESLKKVKTGIDDPQALIKSESLNLLKKSKAKMDSSSFGYAIALSDNAGLFENKEIVSDIRDGALLLLEDEDKQPIDIANNYKDAGELSYAASQFRAAEVAFLTSKLVFETNYLQDHVNYAGVISDLGLLNHTMGKYKVAEDYTNLAMEERSKKFGDESPAYAVSLNNLAVLQKDMGLYSDSEKNQTRAIEIFESNKQEDLGYAILLNNKAMLFRTLGRLKEAESILANSLDISEKNQGKKSNSHQKLMTNLAILYKDQQKYNEAETVLLEVISLKEKRLGKYHPDYAHMQTILASLYQEMGQDDKVLELLLSAEDIYVKKLGTNHPAYATNQSHIGNYYRQKGDFDKSEVALKKSLEIRTSALGVTHPDYAKSLEDLAILKWLSDDLDESNKYFTESIELSFNFIEKFFPAMSDVEKTRYWDLLQPRFNRYYAFCSDYYQQNPEITNDFLKYRLATKGLLLSSSQKIKKSILNSGDEELIQKYFDWVTLKESLATYYAFSKEELAEQKVNLDSMENAANLAEKYLSSNSELFESGSSVSIVDFESLKQKLNAEDAAVEVVLVSKPHKAGEAKYMALIVLPDSEHAALTELNSKDELDNKYFKFYRNSIQFKREDDLSFEQFWQPLSESLGDKKTVYLSGDGIYHQINVNTLKTDQGYLIDEYSIHQLTNLNHIINYEKTDASGFDSSFLLGSPDYGESSEILPLPGTKLEVEEINKILQTAGSTPELVMGSEADEEAVKSIDSPALIHIATHGFFMPDENIVDAEQVFGLRSDIAKEQPMLRSGILLKGAAYTYHGMEHKELDELNNGVLTAYEVSSLGLDETDLVVLSACETGLGEVKAGEGVYGLQRAFAEAGAKALIMSLWKVDDTATQKLMTLFYQNLIQSGDLNQAFKNSQIELKKEYPDPYYWGAFVLIGQ